MLPVMNLVPKAVLCMCILCVAAAPPAPSREEQLRSALDRFADGSHKQAFAIVDAMIASNPRDERALLIRAGFHRDLRQFARAIEDYSAAITISPEFGPVYLQRGMCHFRLGNLKQSLADFDKQLELRPQDKPLHWQRGITLYYLGKYKQGREQFEIHKTVNPDDVENAAWHFLCHAREAGVEKARAELMEIQVANDDRVPMAHVYALLAGKATPQEVLDAAAKGEGKALNRQLSYAHLYLALYYEALGKDAQVREHLELAVEKHPVDDYMGDVARVHLKRLRDAERLKDAAKKP